jgi:hypothetical protein
VSHIPCAPLILPWHLDPEKAEATVTFGVDLTAINCEALSDRGFHLGHSTSSLCVDIRADAMASVHNEGSFVHTGL